MRRASIFARFVAFLIDLSIIAFFSGMTAVAALAGYSAGSGGLTFLSFSAVLLFCLVFSSLLFLFYFTFLTMGPGMTIGKNMLSIRVIRSELGGAAKGLGFFRSLVRAVGYVLSASVCFFGFFMAVVFRGITFHDLVAGTEVVDAHEGES
ncbi:MAG: RDD family protein [Syntrophobacterales bacterium]|jgi:uncharacterized RDD family membrane protein YckC|nr:RDD family protein [Syntrophobacterales bacterium]